MFINPWVFCDSDDIPDLTPHDDEEMTGCLASTCGFIISATVFALLMHFILDLRLNNIISTDVHFIFILINCIIIFPILTIILMKLPFKIGDKIYKKKRK